MTWFSLQTTITEDAYSAALEVVAAYDGAVVYSQAASAMPGANGLGVYLPSTPNSYENSGGDYPVMAPESFAFWQDYLNQFYSTITRELDGSALQLEIKDVFTVGENGSLVDIPVISFDAAGKGVVSLEYTITYAEADDTHTIVDISPLSYTSILPTGETLIEYPNELTPSTFIWSAQFPYVSDGSNEVLSVLSPQHGGNNGIVWGAFINEEGSQEAYLVFDGSTFEYIGVVAIVNGKVHEPSPVPGDQFIVDLISITDEGEKIRTPQTDTPLTFGLQPFTFAYLAAESGHYKAGLTINDLAGNSLYKEIDITINNDDVDGTLLGYTDTNEGVYFQYPYAWGASDLFTHDDGSSTNAVSDDEGVQSLFVDAYPEADAQSVLDSVLSLVQGDISEVTETTLGGLPAYSATYATVLEDGSTSYSTLYSVFNEESGAAVVFTLQSSVEDATLDEQVISILDGTLTLFAPI